MQGPTINAGANLLALHPSPPATKLLARTVICTATRAESHRGRESQTHGSRFWFLFLLGLLFFCPPPRPRVMFPAWSGTRLPEGETSCEEAGATNTCEPRRHKRISNTLLRRSVAHSPRKLWTRPGKPEWSQGPEIEVFNQGGCQNRCRA